MKLNQHAKYLGRRSFSSKVIVQTEKNTHRTDDFTWTTKMVGHYVVRISQGPVHSIRLAIVVYSSCHDVNHARAPAEPRYILDFRPISNRRRDCTEFTHEYRPSRGLARRLKAGCQPTQRTNVPGQASCMQASNSDESTEEWSARRVSSVCVVETLVHFKGLIRFQLRLTDRFFFWNDKQ